MGSTNPLLARLTRKKTWLSARGALWLALGLGLLGLALSTRSLLQLRSTSFNPLTVALLVAAWALTILSPPVVAIIAATLTSREIESGAHDMLSLTPVSETAQVWGYILAAFYRARLWLALAVGLMPTLVIGMMNISLVAEAILYNILFYYPEGFYGESSHSLDPNVLPFALLSLAIVLGSWGVNWLAAALGVGLALRWRRRIIASIFAPLVALFCSLALPASSLLIPGDLGSTGKLIIWMLVLVLVPCGLSAVATDLAFRWARRLPS